MRIYRNSPPDNAEAVIAATAEARDMLLRGMDGTPLGAAWVPPVVKLVREDQGEDLVESDMPFASGSPVLGVEAAKLAQALPGDFELLPLWCDDGEFFVLNATRVLVDAIDEDASGIVRLSSGKITAIKRPAFIVDAVRDVPLFRLQQHPRAVYFGDEWVMRLSTLRNVAFATVWDSEETAQTVA